MAIHYRFILRAYINKALNGNKYPIIGEESIMSRKDFGSAVKPVQENLRWNASWARAKDVCCFNRVYPEFFGYA